MFARIKLQLGAACLLAGAVSASTATAGETLELTGRLYADRAANLLPLANGTGVMNVEVSGIAAMSGNPPVIYAVGCAGLGLVDAEGKADTQVYCTFTESDADAFDVKGKVREGDGKLEVIGGSGRFAGATGGGRFLRADKAGGPGTGIVEVSIKTK